MFGNLRITIIGLILAVLMLPGDANADLSARYDTKFPGTDEIIKTMTIEINERGDLRYQLSDQALYGLVIDGVDYVVKRGPTGLYVIRIEDMVAAAAASNAATISKLSEEIAKAPNESFFDFIENGAVEVNGRSGTGYAMKQEDGSPGLFNILVISDDPKLAPLGAAFAQQFRSSMRMAGGFGLGNVEGPFSGVIEVIDKGAILSFSGMELSEVDFDPIDPQRFALPAEPITLEQAIALEMPFAIPPTLTDPFADSPSNDAKSADTQPD